MADEDLREARDALRRAAVTQISADLDALRRSCTLTEAVLRTICVNLHLLTRASSASPPRDDDPLAPRPICTRPPSNTDDLETLRAIKRRFSHNQSTSDTDDLEMLRAIKRRFSHNQSGPSREFRVVRDSRFQLGVVENRLELGHKGSPNLQTSERSAAVVQSGRNRSPATTSDSHISHQNAKHNPHSDTLHGKRDAQGTTQKHANPYLKNSQNGHHFPGSGPAHVPAHGNQNINRYHQGPTNKKAVQPIKEWKPKSAEMSLTTDADNSIDDAISPSASNAENANSPDENGLSDKLSQANLHEVEHVFIPEHLRVPEYEQFSNFTSGFDSEQVPASDTEQPEHVQDPLQQKMIVWPPDLMTDEQARSSQHLSTSAEISLPPSEDSERMSGQVENDDGLGLVQSDTPMGAADGESAQIISTLTAFSIYGHERPSMHSNSEAQVYGLVEPNVHPQVLASSSQGYPSENPEADNAVHVFRLPESNVHSQVLPSTSEEEAEEARQRHIYKGLFENVSYNNLLKLLHEQGAKDLTSHKLREMAESRIRLEDLDQTGLRILCTSNKIKCGNLTNARMRSELKHYKEQKELNQEFDGYKTRFQNLKKRKCSLGR